MAAAGAPMPMYLSFIEPASTFNLSYTISALGPFLLGALRDTAGSFTLAMWVIFAITGIILVILVLTSQERLLVPAHRARRHAESR